MRAELIAKLVKHINRKDWWHVPPCDPGAYRKRGKFLASSFRDAEFWGRPLDTPIRVSIKNPIVGDERTVNVNLLGSHYEPPADKDVLEWRWALDAKLMKAALAKGHDSIVLLTPAAFLKFRSEGKIPRSIELNLLQDFDRS